MSYMSGAVVRLGAVPSGAYPDALGHGIWQFLWHGSDHVPVWEHPLDDLDAECPSIALAGGTDRLVLWEETPGAQAGICHLSGG